MSTVVAQLGQFGNQFGPVLFKTLFDQNVEDFKHTENILRYFRVVDTHKPGNNDLKLVPRAILIDTEPKAVDSAIKKTRGKKEKFNAYMRYDKSNSFTMQGGAGNNWAYGHNILAPMLMERTSDLLRLECERCDRLDSILILSSLAGGTGSGVGSALSQHLRDEYRGCQLAIQTIFPMANEVLTQDINAVLSLAALYCVAPTMIASNDELKNVFNYRLHSSPSTKGPVLPSFDDINSTLALQLSSSIRDSSLSCVIDNSIDSYIRKCLLIRRCPPLSIGSSVLTTKGLLASTQRMIITGHYNDECYPREEHNIYGGHITLRNVDDTTEIDSFNRVFNNKLTTTVKGGKQMEAGIILNSSSIRVHLGQLKASLLRKLSVNAYIHHYDKYGISREDIINSLRVISQMESDYGK